MQEVNLGCAGRKDAHDLSHDALSHLETNDPLGATQNGDKILLMRDDVPVAALSKSASEAWRDRLSSIESIRVLAKVSAYS